MMKWLLLLIVAAGLTRLVMAQPLTLAESPRIVGMGGAYVAVANDPQAGLLNPAGLRGLRQLAYDGSYSDATGRGPDFLSYALVNPGTERGTVFAAGAFAQGWTRHARLAYYVPYVGSSWQLSGSSFLGLTLRFPYRRSRMDSISSGWETLADLSVLQQLSTLRLGGSLERAWGSSGDYPRRLKVGAALTSPDSYAIAYEWRGDETHERFHFRYESSHLGGEVVAGEYVALRAGYVWSATHRVSAGCAIGLLKEGWRMEMAWEVPTVRPGTTRWSAGLGYRL